MLSNCGAKKTLESPLDSKEIKPVYPKGNQPWIFIGRMDAEAEAEALMLQPLDVNEESTHWKRPWCWERLRARGERGNTGWDDWIASLIKWTWVWANSRFVMNREAWRAAVHEVTMSRTGLRDWTTTTMYGCKSWTVQKVEWQRIGVF